MHNETAAHAAASEEMKKFCTAVGAARSRANFGTRACKN